MQEQTQKESNQNQYSIQIYTNIFRIYTLLQLYEKPFQNPINEDQNPQDNQSIQNKNYQKHSKLLISLSFFYFSNYKYKLDINFPNTPFTDSDKYLLIYINKLLELINSKFLLSDSLTEDEFITISLYFISEFDLMSNLIESLKEYESNTLTINFQKIFELFTPNFDTKNDNLYNESRKPSSSSMESFSKLNFVLKNIKKQVDLFINMIYKINQIKVNQPKLINSLKLEEIVLFSDDNLFNKYCNDFFVKNNDILNMYLANINKIIDILDNTFDIYQRIFDSFININKYIINEKYNSNNKNSKINTIKNLFTLKIVCDKSENCNKMLENIQEYMKFLENNMNDKLAKIKNENSELINSPQVSETLDKLSVQLEKFIHSNEKSIKTLLLNFEEDKCENEIDFIKKLIYSGGSISDVYENYLVLNKAIEEMYNTYKEEMNGTIENCSNVIKGNFNIFNNTK